jgi:hypothetical protein
MLRKWRIPITPDTAATWLASVKLPHNDDFRNFDSIIEDILRHVGYLDLSLTDKIANEETIYAHVENMLKKTDQHYGNEASKPDSLLNQYRIEKDKAIVCPKIIRIRKFCENGVIINFFSQIFFRKN